MEPNDDYQNGLSITQKDNCNNIRCPLCRSSDTKIIRRFKRDEIVKHLGISEDNQKRETVSHILLDLWNHKDSSFLECDNCFLHFAHPFISGNSEFYNIAYDQSVKYPEWKWDFEVAWNFLTSVNNGVPVKNKNMLEIGAGDGSFVKRVVGSHFLPENIQTTEYSDYGRKKIKNLGIESLPIDIIELLKVKGENSFDFIFMFQVLEHLDNLGDTFLSLNKLLKKDGHLFITVPNNLSRMKFEKISIVEDIPPMHIGRYNFDCFNYIAKKYDFELINHQIQKGSFKASAVKYLHSQYKRTKISSKLNNSKKGYKRKALIAHIYMLLSIRHIFKFKYFVNSKNMGVSQLVHFTKR